MTLPPQTTIIIPTHKRPHYLPLAIESALWQDTPCRIVVVSDADPGARATANQYNGQLYRPVEYVELEEHGDLSGCMNRGIALTETPYLMMLQDDDMALPHKARTLAQFLNEHPHFAAVCSLSTTMDETGAPHAISDQRLAKYREMGLAGINRANVVTRNPIDQPTVLYRTDALRAVGGFPVGNRYSEEMELHMRLLDAGYNIGFCDCVTARYRMHAANKTLAFTQDQRAEANAIRAAYKAKWFSTPPPVIASMATMKERERSFRRVLRTLLPQVDRLNVYLHGYTAKPRYLRDPKITVIWDGPDRQDRDKFYWADKLPTNCYHFTCDDDLLYPPDYVRSMIAAIERYGRKAVISCHGAILDPLPIANYFVNQTRYVFRRDVPQDVAIDIAGTGVLAYHSSALTYSQDWHLTPFASDMWFSLACIAQGVPRICKAHRLDWIRYNGACVDEHRCIFHWRKKYAIRETATLNACDPARFIHYGHSMQEVFAHARATRGRRQYWESPEWAESEAP